MTSQASKLLTRSRRRALLVTTLAPAMILAGLSTPPALAAAAAAPAWSLRSISQPSSFSPADNGSVGCEETDRYYSPCDRYTLVLTNIGTAPTSGTITVKDTLPAGVTVSHRPNGEDEQIEFEWACATEEAAGREVVTCTAEHTVPSLTAAPAIEIPVNVPASAGPLVNEVTVSGGEAAEVRAEESTPVAAPPEPFAPLDYSFSELGEAGGLDTEAASHPGAITSSFLFPTAMAFKVYQRQPYPVEDVKQIVTDLPPGVVGDALAAPTCPVADASTLTNEETQCPAATRVGKLVLNEARATNSELSIFNVTPERGYPAEFAVFLPAVERSAFLYASIVGTGAESHVRVISAPQNRTIALAGVSLTLFGVPALVDGAPLAAVPFFTNPSDCAASGFTSDIYVDSWQHPGRVLPDGQPDLSDPNWRRGESTSPGVTGCEALHFHPTLTLAPEPGHTQADEPSGYSSTLRVPQSQEAIVSATPPLKRTVVTLPPGVAISPSAANGLVGCQEGGAEGIELESPDAGHCPAASTVGSVEVITPLLKEPLTGSVYVAQPSCGGDGQPACTEEGAETGGVFALYLEVGSENEGVHLKLRGTVEVGGDGHRNGLEPGQVRTTFAETPQDPFSELKLNFNSGPRAPLANPQGCGTFTSAGELEAWSHIPATGEKEGTPNVTLNPSFAITGCQSRFAPAFTAGTISPQAGAYDPFTLTFSRQDREQSLSGITVSTPKGLLGKIAGIVQCAASEANAGTCPAGSRLGSATAAAGSGTTPYWQTGSVYLTGPYGGAPYGLSIVVPAKAGPYNLGNIVVRAAIHINPSTAVVTVVSNPLPQMIDGVPLRVKTVNVMIGAEDNFTFNPTNCSEQAIGATITSAQGTNAEVSTRFQAANCAALPFKPSLTASTQGKTSKADGASLLVKITAKPGEANLAKTDLQIPLQLPARNSTLQQACLQAQFEANPAGCPAGSVVGTATVHTPVLNVPLTGPMYLVSHGGAAFPDIEIVLQGENVEIVLDGKTDIKKAITYSRFEAIPDAPFSVFEADLPEGPHSILGTNLPHESRDLCGRTLTIPTKLVGQNGAVIERNTPVTVDGCPTTIAISSHSTSKRTLTLSVFVPAAGKLSLSGNGFSSSRKVARGAETLTFKLKLKQGRKLSTRISVIFTPMKGGKQVKSLAVKFKR